MTIVGGLYCEFVGDGPPLVFTHDALMHHEGWDAQFAEFAADYRVARWDRRGYGRSAAPTEKFSSVDDLATVIRAVSDRPAIVVGCSFGSLVTAQVGLDHPELVAALVLVGPLASGLPLSEHFLTRGGRGQPAPDAPDAEQIAYWCETDPWYIAPANTAARRRLRDMLTANPQNLRPRWDLEQLPTEPALPRFGEISVPTLIIVGEHDVPDVHAAAGATEAAIPGARRIILPGSGHLPHLETPEAFNTTLRDFLNTLP